MVDALVSFLLDIKVGPWLDARTDRRLAERHARRRRTRCFLRVRTGTQDGLSRRWREGRLEVGSDSLVFRGHHAVTVLEVDGSWSRKLGVRESLRLQPRTRVVRLTTPTAQLELALNSADAAWACGALQPAGVRSD